MTTVTDLQTGSVTRIKPTQLAKLAGESAVTIGRKIKSKHIEAITDPASGRIFIPVESALRYLSGETYKHDHQNEAALSRMERARAAKPNKHETTRSRK